MTATAAPPRAPGRAPAAPPPAPRNRVHASGILGPSVASGLAVLLAAAALGPLLDSGSWFGPTVLSAATVVVVGALATWVRTPLFLVPVVQAVALFSVLVARYTTDAPLGFVPTPDSLSALRAILSDGMTDIDRYAPPVPVSPGVAAVTALGIGCVAVVVFVLEVNLRMPVSAGLALVAVYVVPALVLDGGAPWWGFAAVALGWMLLLASDERVDVVSWGRVLRRSEGGAASSALSGLSSAGLRIGVVAILAAVLLPALVPSLADAVLGRHATGFGDGTGTGTAPAQVGLDPFVSLRRDLLQQPDVVVLRYTTDAAQPSYLRTVVLEQYSGERWSPRAFDPASASAVGDGAALPSSVGAGVATTPHHYEISADRLAATYLPLPANVTSVRGLSGQWYADEATGTVFGVDSTTSGARWSVDALDAAPTTAQLEAATNHSSPDTESLRNASDIPADVATLARTVTAGASTDFESAVLLQNWFLRNFTYSTDAASDQSTPALESFLRDRSGYCQQFAAAMALMARSLGIPSRVVVGYTPGTRDGDTWVVRGKDAHAWPELFFPGVGWVRFEPTPRSAADGGSVTVPAYAQQVPTTTTTSTSTSGTSATAIKGKPGARINEDAAGASSVDVPPVTTPDQWRERGLLAVLVLAAVAACVPAAVRWTRRRRRLSAAASVEDAWEELRDTARDLGIPWSEARTPRQAVADVVAEQRLAGEVADAAVRIGRVTERARYAATPPPTDGLAEDVGAVRTALLARADRGTRVRAVLLPPSLRPPR